MAVLNPADRRAWPRRSLAEIPNLSGVRIASEEVKVIDASDGGLLVEGGFSLRPGVSSRVEVVDANGASFWVAGSVVRCHVASLGPQGLRYRIAIAFEKLVALTGQQAANSVGAAAAATGAFAAGFIMDFAEAATCESAFALNNW